MDEPDLLPLTSRPPLPILEHSLLSANRTPIISPEGLREDGRTALQMSHLFVRTGVSRQAVGSCYLSRGSGTKIFCSVFGPRPNASRIRAKLQQRTAGELGEIIITVNFSPFTGPGIGRVTKTGGGSGQFHKEKFDDDTSTRLSNSLVEVFNSIVLTEKFNNSSLEISLLVIESDGQGLFACAVNAVSMALADGGIPMKDVCCAVTVGIFDSPSDDKSASHLSNCMKYSGSLATEVTAKCPIKHVDITSKPVLILLDITAKEAKHQKDYSEVVAAICPSTGTIAFLDAFCGFANLSSVITAMQIAVSACAVLGFTLKDQLRKSLQAKKAEIETEEQMINQMLELVSRDKTQIDSGAS